MAFVVPSHLPRKAFVQPEQSLGSTSKSYDDILAKVGSVSWENLNSSAASSWVTELTNEIDTTRSSIRSRIHVNFPDFERELKQSKDIVTRVHGLTTDMDNLTTSLYDQENGLLPTLSRRISEHATLTQRAKDAEILSTATRHAVQCREALEQLSSLVLDARLPESVSVSQELERLIREAPEPLPRAHIFQEIKNRFRVLYDSAQEQLDDAYVRAISFNSSESREQLVILQSVPLPRSQNTITLREIFDSLTPEAALRSLTSLRKALLTKFFEPIIASNGAVSSDGMTITFHRSESPSDLIEGLSIFVAFLRRQLFDIVPPSYTPHIITALFPSVLSSLLQRLKKTIPSSLADLPPYIDLVDRAVDFEHSIIEALPPNSSPQTLTIADWASSLPNHYEKRRREVILQSIRDIVGDEARLGGLRVDRPHRHKDDDIIGSSPGLVHSPAVAVATPSITSSSTSSAPATVEIASAVEEEEDGWGFDDLDGADEDEVAANVEPSASLASAPEPESEQLVEEADPWDDDPWGDPEVDDAILSPSVVSSPSAVPKSAKGLEKFSSKTKGNASGEMSPPASFTNGSATTHPIHVPTQTPSPPLPEERPRTPVVKETFIVSECAQEVQRLLHLTAQESADLSQSRVFHLSSTKSSSPLGSLLMSSISTILDLFRALAPVEQSEMMALSPALRIRFANDCSYLASDVNQLASSIQLNGELSAKLAEASERLATVGEQWFDDCLDNQKREVLTILNRANGFIGTGDDTQYAIQQSIVDHAAETLSTFAHDWKGTLAPSVYLDACGFMVEETLSSVLRDILSLPDIPELESHRLNALCQKLDSLKDLFVVNAGEESFVGAYVPSWFKFSYMAELLEASLADITYLFESGALIDFEREELVQLVQGLFSDTPLRAKTIDKIRSDM